jgi:hypothetical protein
VWRVILNKSRANERAFNLCAWGKPSPVSMPSCQTPGLASLEPPSPSFTILSIAISEEYVLRYIHVKLVTSLLMYFQAELS